MQTEVHHYRRLEGGDLFHQWKIKQMGLTDRIQPRGGITVVDVFDDEGTFLGSGRSFCSNLDNYNKKMGRLIATGRALKGLQT